MSEKSNLWGVFVISDHGDEDVIPAPDHKTALEWAGRLHVMEWPYGLASHAAGVDDKWKEVLARTEPTMGCGMIGIKAPHAEQSCYDLGYANPSIPMRMFMFDHEKYVYAYIAGQSDTQNHAPRNIFYDRKSYDIDI
jgi:hypothetical protein